MVWYRLEPQLCKVVTHLAPRPAPGDNWCNIAPPKTDAYPVHIWNAKYPAFKVAVPSHCGPAPQGSTQNQPAASPPLKKYPGETSSGPVTGPVTGPTDDPCAPAMAERAGSESKYGFKTAEHLTMPRTGTFFSVRTGADHVGASVEPGYTGKPLETRPARVKSSGGMITIAEPGSGDGFIVFAPDDLNEFCLRGDGVHPEGKWPAKIAQNTFLIMSGASAGGGDNVRNLLAWGMPSARTRGKPVSGVYIEHDPDTNVINIQHTDADGVDTSVVSGVTIDGVAVGTGSGDVTASANMTDNTLLRGDGGAKGIQDSGITVDDSDNVSGVVNLTNTGKTIHTPGDVIIPSTPQNALDLTSKTVWKITDDSAGCVINGLAAGTEGQRICLVNTEASKSQTLSHESGTASSAAGRMYFSSGGNLTLGPGDTVWFVYAASRWRSER